MTSARRSASASSGWPCRPPPPTVSPISSPAASVSEWRSPARSPPSRPLLVCDEVTSALDVSVQAAIIELLGQLRNEMGLSLLFITHDLALIRTIADRVAVVTGGHIVEYGPCEQIFTSPSADYTRKLLANTPSIEVALGQLGPGHRRLVPWGRQRQGDWRAGRDAGPRGPRADVVWGIPGTHNLEIYAHLPGAGIRHVSPRHEQGAGFAADGYARVTGRPGVCIMTSGPAMLNAATALGPGLLGLRAGPGSLPGHAAPPPRRRQRRAARDEGPACRAQRDRRLQSSRHERA